MNLNMYFHFPYVFSFFHCKNLFCTAVKHTFRIFTGVLPDVFLLHPANIQNLRKSLSNSKKKYIYNKQKIQFFSTNTGFHFILWYENYHISLVSTATHEFFFHMPQYLLEMTIILTASSVSVTCDVILDFNTPYSSSDMLVHNLSIKLNKFVAQLNEFEATSRAKSFSCIVSARWISCLYVPSSNVSRFCNGAGVLSLNRVKSRRWIARNCEAR
jgi:hypothetical protein